MNKKDGGHAYPWNELSQLGGDTSVYSQSLGMTMRQYYKAQILVGLLSYSAVNPANGNYHENCTPKQAVYAAGAMADLMIEEDAEFSERTK